MNLFIIAVAVLWGLVGPVWAENYYICSGSVFDGVMLGEQRCIPDPDVAGHVIRFPTSSCEQRMAEAMRAMEPYLVVTADSSSYDGCNYCTDAGCTLMACTSGGNEIARLEWELNRARERQKRRDGHAAALKLWAEVKRECWGTP